MLESRARDFEAEICWHVSCARATKRVAETFKIKKMHAIVKDDCVMLPMSLDVSCSVCNDQAYHPLRQSWYDKLINTHKTESYKHIQTTNTMVLQYATVCYRTCACCSPRVDIEPWAAESLPRHFALSGSVKFTKARAKLRSLRLSCGTYTKLYRPVTRLTRLRNGLWWR